MSDNKLFSDFPTFSKEDWIAKIEHDLKGKPYSDLTKKNVLGSSTEPVFTDSNLPQLDPNRRGTKTNGNDWHISEKVLLSADSKADNQKILGLLNAGLTGIELSGQPEIDTLKGIAPEYIATEFSDYSSLSELTKTLTGAFGEISNTYPIHLNFDPITNAAITGKWSNKNTELNEGLKAIKNLINYKATRVFSVKAHAYHNCGAGAISEIGLALAQSHEYLVFLLESGLSIDEASAQIKIDLASGRDYFTEIAKFRAFRIIWAAMIDAYNPEHACSKSVQIHANTSEFWNTVYDPHVNMLRATTQAMSAAIGGTDALTVAPYNSAWENGNEFSNRIARNVQLLLKEETYLDKVIDPAGGSYYIESLTQELAEKAWIKFKKIEAKGGFIGLVTSGNLHRELKEEADAQIDLFNNGKLPVLGVNLYPNENETALEKIIVLEELDPAALETDFPPIEQIRLTGKVEQERLKSELEAAK